MPLLFAGGVCCVLLVFVEVAGLLAGAGVVAGLLTGALLASDAGDGLLVGVELAAGAAAGGAPLAAAGLSAASAPVLFFNWDFFVRVAESVPAFAAESVLDAELLAASAVALFFELDFFGVVTESPPFAEESAATVWLSVTSGAVLFLERDFFGVVAVELSEAAASVLPAAFFLGLGSCALGRVRGRVGTCLRAVARSRFLFALLLGRSAGVSLIAGARRPGLPRCARRDAAKHQHKGCNKRQYHSLVGFHLALSSARSDLRPKHIVSRQAVAGFS